MVNPMMFFDTVATASPRLVNSLSSTPRATMSLATAKKVAGHFAGTDMGDVIKGFIQLAGKSSPDKTILTIERAQSELEPNISTINVMVKNVKGYMAKLVAKVNQATKEVKIEGKVKGIQNAEEGFLEASAITFKRLATDKHIDIDVAQKMADKARSMGVNVKAKMEEILAGNYEGKFNPHLVAESKGNLGIANAAGHFNKRFRFANKPVLMLK